MGRGDHVVPRPSPRVARAACGELYVATGAVPLLRTTLQMTCTRGDHGLCYPPCVHCLAVSSENHLPGDAMTEAAPNLIADPKQRGILIVEDEFGPREAMRYVLKSRAYVNMHFAQNGQEALDKLAALGS